MTLFCADAESVAVYLSGERGQTYGRVEIVHNKSRWTVCGDNWGENEAKVVCRMLRLRR